MVDFPWSKFFWSDWESDQGLRLCSLAAQGLWMRLLCVAAKHEPKGYVAIKGNPLTANDIARLAGASESEAETLMDELDRNGVYSRDRTGRIYSRRMLRDEKRAKTSRKNGKNGGNPSLRKQRGIQPRVIPPDKGRVKTQRPEAICQKPEELSPNVDSSLSSSPSSDDVGDADVNVTGDTRAGRQRYAFEYGIIRLSRKHFENWQTAYPNINLPAELTALEPWAAKKGSQWFFALPNALAKKDREMLLAKEKLLIEATTPRPVSGVQYAI